MDMDSSDDESFSSVSSLGQGDASHSSNKSPPNNNHNNHNHINNHNFNPNNYHNLRTESMCTSVMNVLLSLTQGREALLNDVLNDVDDDVYYVDLEPEADLLKIHDKYITKGLPFGWINKTLILEEIGIFHQPLAIEYRPLLCLAVLMRLINLMYRSRDAGNPINSAFTQDELMHIYEAVSQVLVVDTKENATNKNTKTRADMALHRMVYFVLKEFILGSAQFRNKSVTVPLTIVDSNDKMIPNALRLIVLGKEDETDKLAAETETSTFLEGVCKLVRADPSLKATSVFLVLSCQFLEQHPTTSSSALTVFVHDILSSESGPSDDSMVRFHALQLLLLMDRLYNTDRKDANFINLLENFRNNDDASPSPLSNILWIRHIERQLLSQEEIAQPQEIVDGFESFLEYQLQHTSEMVVLEAARVICTSSERSTGLMETAVSTLQLYAPTETSNQQKIKRGVRREASRLLDVVGQRFLSQLGIQ